MLHRSIEAVRTSECRETVWDTKSSTVSLFVYLIVCIFSSQKNEKYGSDYVTY